MNKFVGLTVSTSMLMLLGGCLSSKSTSGSSINSNVMSGVAATGAPISNGTVEIKGKNGVKVSKLTSSDGSYSANISELEEPYLVRVIAPSGEKYISVASKSALVEGKKINVTPLSHTIVANVFEDADADSVFEDFENKAQDYSDAKLKSEKDKLVQKFIDAGLLGTGKIAPANIDLLNGDLKAGTSIGLDGLLDVIDVNTGASAGIEIKMKGASTPFIVDKVAAVDAPVINVSSLVTAAKAQLSVIDAIRKQMNALAALFSSYASCNGPARNDASACGLDSIHTALKAYFHPEYLEEGRGRDAAVWGWICEGNGRNASSKDDCLSSELEFGNVYLKDITLISYDDSTKVAVISLNVYENGKLAHAEEMTLKYDSGNSKYKLLGNKKTFDYWIDTESVHSTEINKSTGDVVESYDVNLNFYYRDPVDHTFAENQSFVLEALSGHKIFNAADTTNGHKMTLYLVKGPSYDEDGVCSPGLVFSTSLTPYKIYNSDGSTSMASYASACGASSPCNCQNGGVQANFDHDTIRMKKLTLAEISKMDKFEKISLKSAGTPSLADEFVIKKPLVINALNAKTYIPQFGMTSSALCANTNFSMPLDLSVKSGTLSDVSLHYGVSRGGGWDHDSARENNLWDLRVNELVFNPVFSNLISGDVVQYTSLYIGARDEYDRRFVRRVNCY